MHTSAFTAYKINKYRANLTLDTAKATRAPFPAPLLTESILPNAVLFAAFPAATLPYRPVTTEGCCTLHLHTAK